MASETLDIIINAKDQASGAIKNIGSALGGIGKFAAGAAIAGVAAIGTAAAGAAVGIAKLTQEGVGFQNVQNAFDGFAESVGKYGPGLVSELSYMANGMIDNQELMLSFNKAAQLVGTDFAQRLPEAFGALGKVASATGQDMGFLLDSLVTGVGRLSPMILDNLGIQVDLTQATEDYAKVLGKEASELTKTEQQTALMNQVLEKLGKNTASLPEIADPFKRASVAVSNFRQTVSKSIAGVMLPIFEKLADKAAFFLDILERYVFAPILFEDIVDDVDHLSKPLQTVVKLARDMFQVFKAFASGGIMGGIDKIGWLIERNLGQKAYQAFINIRLGIVRTVEFVKTRLIPGFQAAMAWISANVVPVLSAVVQWFIAKIPEAIAWLSDKWTNVLLPAVQAFGEWAQTVLIPALQQLWSWLQENIPIAIEALRNAWETVLLPALQTFWTFLSENVIPTLSVMWQWFKEKILPVLVALADFVSAVLGVAFKALVGFWQNVLMPALSSLWNFIKNKLNISLGDTGGVLSKLTEMFHRFADAIRNLQLPDWLTPGSPTPLEIGLKGITAAMKQLNSTGLPQLTMAPQGAQVGASQPMAAALAPVSGGYNVTINYSPAVSTASAAEMQRFKQMLDEGMRQVQRGRR